MVLFYAKSAATLATSLTKAEMKFKKCLKSKWKRGEM